MASMTTSWFLSLAEATCLRFYTCITNSMSHRHSNAVVQTRNEAVILHFLQPLPHPKTRFYGRMWNAVSCLIQFGFLSPPNLMLKCGSQCGRWGLVEGDWLIGEDLSWMFSIFPLVISELSLSSHEIWLCKRVWHLPLSTLLLPLPPSHMLALRHLPP